MDLGRSRFLPAPSVGHGLDLPFLVTVLDLALVERGEDPPPVSLVAAPPLFLLRLWGDVEERGIPCRGGGGGLAPVAEEIHTWRAIRRRSDLQLLEHVAALGAGRGRGRRSGGRERVEGGRGGEVGRGKGGGGGRG